MHPFHPLAGQEFELVGYAHTWGEHRVFFRRPGEGRVRTLPAGWTDVVAVDPSVLLAAGRSFTRVEDLLRLAALLAEVAEGVKEIPPDCRSHYAGGAERRESNQAITTRAWDPRGERDAAARTTDGG